MSVEQIFAKKIENQTEENKKTHEKTLKEIFQDQDNWEVFSLILEKENKDDLAIKLNELFEKGTIEEADLKEIFKEKDKALGVVNNSENIVKFLNEEQMFTNIITRSPELERLCVLWGSNNILEMFTKKYLIKLYFDDPESFEKLTRSIEAYKKINEEVKELDNEIAEFAEEFEIPIDLIEEVIETKNQRAREGKMMALVQQMPLFKIWGKKDLINLTVHSRGKKEFKIILDKFEDMFKRSNEAIGGTGEELWRINKEDIAKKISADTAVELVDNKPEEEQEFTFNDLTSVAFRKKEIQNNFAKLKNNMAKGYGKIEKKPNFRWDDFNPVQKAEIKTAFQKKEIFRDKKGNSFWGKILDKFVKLVM